METNPLYQQPVILLYFMIVIFIFFYFLDIFRDGWGKRQEGKNH